MSCGDAQVTFTKRQFGLMKGVHKLSIIHDYETCDAVQVTFTKRKFGLMKKAYELSICLW